MAEALPLIKKQLSIESDKVNKQINIKADSIITLIDLLKKKEAVDEEAKDMLTKVESSVTEIQELNTSLHSTISNKVEVKKKSNLTFDTFGVNVKEFQFLLASQFDASVINCSQSSLLHASKYR